MDKVTDKFKALVKKVKRALGGYPRATKVHGAMVSDSGIIEVTYHATTVVTIHTDAQANPTRIVLDSGMWHTVTTRKRMNDVLTALVSYWERGDRGFSCYVYQSKRRMGFGFHGWKHIETPGSLAGERRFYNTTQHYKGARIPFVDGLTMHLYKNGSLRKVTNENGEKLMSVNPWKTKEAN